MRLPWSIELYQRYGRRLTARSFLRLRSALVAERAGKLGFADTIVLHLRGPARTDFRMRPVSNDIYTFNEVFAEEVYGLIRRRLPDVRTVIDLGANIGLSSIYFLAHYPAARVLAVEPDPQNFALLTENLASYVNQKRATVVQGALWASDGPVVFERPSAPGHVNQGAVVGSGEGNASERHFVVPGWTMPTLLTQAGFDRVDLLKVDIEGGEEHLFKGDASWLDRVGCLAIEFHDDTRQKSRFDDRMREFGFTVEDANAHTVVAVRQQREDTT